MENNNNFYQQPIAATQPVQAPAAKKKSALGKQHIFMGVAILLANGIIPAILSAIYTAITTLIADSVSYYDNSYTISLNLTSSVYTLVLGLITVVIYAVFGYLAYKKLAKAACFIGVSFVAVKLSGFLTGIINVFLSLVGVIVNAIDSSAYYDYLGVQTVLNGLVGFFGVILSIAIGILLLMIVEKGRLNINKNKAPVQQMPVQN